MFRSLILALFACALLSPSAHALCQKWGQAQQVGELNSNIINESSGMEVSTKGAKRLFHINDSGDGPHFYVTDVEGKGTRTIEVEGFSPDDVEDLTLGPCPKGEGSCLVIGDIGDNARLRSHVSLVFIQERERFKQKVSPQKILRVRYPDGAHNAEGLAMNAAGDIFVLTKETRLFGHRAAEAELFVLRRDDIRNSTSRELEFEHLGSLDFPKLLRNDFGTDGKIVTAFDIDPKNSRALILTYETALEVKWSELAPSAGMNVGNWQFQRDFYQIPLRVLPKQEATVLTSEGMYYSTESKEGNVKASLYFVPCEGSMAE